MRLRFFRRWSKQTGSISRLAIVRRARVKRLSRLRMMSAGCNTSRNMLLGSCALPAGYVHYPQGLAKDWAHVGTLGRLSDSGTSRLELDDSGWFQFRRIVRGWRLAQARGRKSFSKDLARRPLDEQTRRRRIKSARRACCSAKIRCYLVVEGCLSDTAGFRAIHCRSLSTGRSCCGIGLGLAPAPLQHGRVKRSAGLLRCCYSNLGLYRYGIPCFSLLFFLPAPRSHPRSVPVPRQPAPSRARGGA